MITCGLLVRLECHPGKDSAVEEFLSSALPLVQSEAGTLAWFAIRFGRSEYGIVDFFPDDASRDVHLAGPVAAALMARSAELFSQPPKIQKLDVLASKLPQSPLTAPDTKALLLSFEAKPGNIVGVEQFLTSMQPVVEEEIDTKAWFAIRFSDTEFGIFDTFPDQVGRFKHLTGHVPRELAKHALSLLGGLPDPELPNVLAEKLTPTPLS
jgi:quinol monooxygenase YgiN